MSKMKMVIFMGNLWILSIGLLYASEKPLIEATAKAVETEFFQCPRLASTKFDEGVEDRECVRDQNNFKELLVGASSAIFNRPGGAIRKMLLKQPLVYTERFSWKETDQKKGIVTAPDYEHLAFDVAWSFDYLKDYIKDDITNYIPPRYDEFLEAWQKSKDKKGAPQKLHVTEPFFATCEITPISIATKLGKKSWVTCKAQGPQLAPVCSLALVLHKFEGQEKAQKFMDKHTDVFE